MYSLHCNIPPKPGAEVVVIHLPGWTLERGQRVLFRII